MLLSGNGIASAAPTIVRTPGAPASGWTSISGLGSTAVGCIPMATSVRVPFPVPAPRSRTSEPRARSSMSQAIVGSGQSGRTASYAPANAPNDVRRRS
jgi:hypothetical protein